MAAVLYLFITFLLGDLICRRVFKFVSLPARLSAGLLTGLLIGTLFTYFAALGFSATTNPLLYGNAVFFIGAAAVLGWRYHQGVSDILPGWAETDSWDLVFAGAMIVFSCWLMFGTFAVDGNNLKIAGFLWNDFGPNLSIVQSFAVGRNLPTEYPHFIGEPIRYHFLFWFQAGNLEFLGMNIAWALNVISVLTLTAMLILIAEFGRLVFGSKAVGRIGAVLFFFHGSLFYVPFLYSKGSAADAFHSVIGATEWLNSIYVFPGEQWGVWSMGTYLAQRHLPAAIGIFILVLLFLVSRLQQKESENDPGKRYFDADTPAYLLTGFLFGLLPLWNGAVYVAGFAVIASIAVFFRGRFNTVCLLAASALTAVPQMLFLKSGGRPLAELFRWGYVVEPNTVWNVTKYFSFTFGLKSALALIALTMLSGFQRRLFLAAFSLVVLTFCTQLSADIMNNHKFMNLWLVLVNCYVAFTLVRIWRIRHAGKLLAAALLLAVSFGGAIELIRVWNTNDIEVPFGGGPLYEWLYSQTIPTDVFLTANHVHHPILLSGRRIYYGWTYFGWSMGYGTGKRDEIYKKLFSETDYFQLVRMLRDNRIKYIAIDDTVRGSHLKPQLNEAVFETHFDKVFVDQERKYGSLVIYKVPGAHIP